jgi:hypothetical protein
LDRTSALKRGVLRCVDKNEGYWKMTNQTQTVAVFLEISQKRIG